MSSYFKIFFTTILWMLFTGIYAQNALFFDGTDDKIDCGNDTSIQITGKLISLEAWIYPTAWKTNIYDGNVINKEYNTSNYGFMLRVGAGGRLNFAFGNGSWYELNSANTVLSLNSWQHIAGTYDGSMMRIYVNGTVTDSLAVSATISNAIGTPLILGGHTTYIRYYQGLIDEVKIWNIFRNSAEIAQDMSNEICSKTPGLKAYYKFNQGKASLPNPQVKKLLDISGFKNDGTLSGFALTGNSSNWVKGQIISKAVSNGSDTVSACERYTSPSKKFSWTKSGVYTDTIPTYFYGCDSAVTVYLTIRKSSSSTLFAHHCSAYVSPSGVYTWTKSGTYVDYLKNKVQCDSFITVYLKIGGSRDSIYPKVCNSFTGPAGRIYTQSGIYSDTLDDYRNCDSIIDIFLTVSKSSGSGITVNTCHTYVSPSGKYTYRNSGIYKDTISNKKGCDSVISIQLNLMNSSSNLNLSVCNFYKSPSGRYTWTQTGVYKDTLVNHKSCDSIITVNLTVRQSSFNTLNPVSCRSYFSPLTGRIYASSGVYYDTIPNLMGCDSITTINLTIHHINTGVTQNAAVLTANGSGTYQWLDCKLSMSAISGETSKIFTAAKNGDYAVEVMENGCRDTSVCYTVSGLSLAALLQNNGIQIYPNPNNGVFTVLLKEKLNNAMIRVRDITGKIVFELTFEELLQENIHFQHGSGIYLMEISSKDLSLFRKIYIFR